MQTTINLNGKSVTIELTPEQIAAVRNATFNFKDINSFETALSFAGETLEEFNERTESYSAKAKFQEVLAVIANAIRGGKKLGKGDKWFRPWFERVSGGVGLSFYDFVYYDVFAYIASCLCVCDGPQAEHFGKTFTKEWADWMYAE